MSFLGILGGIAGSVLGGIFQNESADKVADAQVAAGDRAAQVQQDMFDRSVELSMPSIRAGNAATDLRLAGLGIGPTSTPQATQATTRPAYGQNFGNIGNEGGFGQYRPTNATIGTGEDPFGILAGFGGANALANFQPQGGVDATKGNTVNTNTFNGTDTAPDIDPNSTQGLQNGAWDQFLGSGFNRAATDVTNSDLSTIKGAYGAGGSLLSGSAQGAMMDRLADNRYGAYINYDNALASISGAGTQSSQVQGQQGMNLANSLSNIYGAQGNARASSYANQNNLLQTGLGAAGQAAQTLGWFK